MKFNGIIDRVYITTHLYDEVKWRHYHLRGNGSLHVWSSSESIHLFIFQPILNARELLKSGPKLYLQICIVFLFVRRVGVLLSVVLSPVDVIMLFSYQLSGNDKEFKSVLIAVTFRSPLHLFHGQINYFNYFAWELIYTVGFFV